MLSSEPKRLFRVLTSSNFHYVKYYEAFLALHPILAENMPQIGFRPESRILGLSCYLDSSFEIIT